MEREIKFIEKVFSFDGYEKLPHENSKIGVIESKLTNLEIENKKIKSEIENLDTE